MKINYPAVLVATVVHFLVGGLWYGLLFSNKFTELIAWSPEKLQEMQNHNPAKELLIAFISALVLVYILAHFVQYTKARTAFDGIQTAFWLWLGFVATTQLATVVFEERKLGLYLINVSYQLVACSLAGVILAVWRPRESKEVVTQTV
jgi:biotin transporter BioY